MSITLESIKAAHEKVGAMIAAFRATLTQILVVARVEIELAEGEHYAGLIIGQDGKPSHHLVLLPGDAENIAWDAANKFAASAGGALPTRQEQALLFANLKGHFQERAYWSSEQHAAVADYAWCQFFGFGFQGNNYKSASLRARAVRRLIIY